MTPVVTNPTATTLPSASTVKSSLVLIPPSKLASPSTVIAPEATTTPATVALNTVESAPPTVSVVPSNVKLASSSSIPDEPAIVTRLSVKSLSVIPAALTSLMPAISLLESSTTALLAAAVPAVKPSICSRSASLITALPIVKPVAVTTPPVLISLEAPSTSALFAAPVPFVIPSSFSRSASFIEAEPIINDPVAVTSVAVTAPNVAAAAVPLNTSLLFVASAMKMNPAVLSSKPKKPVFAPPLLYLNSIPRSLLSSESDEPKVMIGSAIVVTVEATVVVVPETVKLPAIVISVGKPMLILLSETVVSISPDVPSNVNVSVPTVTVALLPTSAAIVNAEPAETTLSAYALVAASKELTGAPASLSLLVAPSTNIAVPEDPPSLTTKRMSPSLTVFLISKLASERMFICTSVFPPNTNDESCPTLSVPATLPVPPTNKFSVIPTPPVT